MTFVISHGYLTIEQDSNPSMPHAKAPFCRCSEVRQVCKDREEDSKALRNATLFRKYVKTEFIGSSPGIGLAMSRTNVKQNCAQYSTTFLGPHLEETLILEDKEACLLE